MVKLNQKVGKDHTSLRQKLVGWLSPPQWCPYFSSSKGSDKHDSTISPLDLRECKLLCCMFSPLFVRNWTKFLFYVKNQNSSLGMLFAYYKKIWLKWIQCILLPQHEHTVYPFIFFIFFLLTTKKQSVQSIKQQPK